MTSEPIHSDNLRQEFLSLQNVKRKINFGHPGALPGNKMRSLRSSTWALLKGTDIVKTFQAPHLPVRTNSEKQHLFHCISFRFNFRTDLWGIYLGKANSALSYNSTIAFCSVLKASTSSTEEEASYNLSLGYKV